MLKLIVLVFFFNSLSSFIYSHMCFTSGEGRCSKHVALADLEQGHWLRMKAESHMDAFGGTFAALGDGDAFPNCHSA